METILNNKDRIGNFTSSEIYKLMSNGKAKDSLGKPALTYIQEKNYERWLGCSLGIETNAKPLTWGKHLESRVFDLLGIEYTIHSHDTIKHKDIDCWSGSADCIKVTDVRTVIDIKCPFTRKAFCEMNDLRTPMDLMEYAPEYYWQLVSNSIINDCTHAELVVYMPYLSELEEIRESTGGIDTIDKSLAWINFSENEELPHIPDGGHYGNIFILNFEVSQADKEALTNRVEFASKSLVERGNKQIHIEILTD